MNEPVTNDEFRLLADNLPTLAWMANADGYIFWYNRRWHEYCGTEPEQVAGWGWQAVHDPAELPAVLAKWHACIASGVLFEMTFPLRGADGVFRPFLTRVQPMRDASGKVTRWFGTNADVSAQAEAEAALRQSEARLRELNETLERRIEERTRERDSAWKNSRDLQVVIDTHGRFRTANDAWFTILGWRPEDVAGRTYQDFLHPDENPPATQAPGAGAPASAELPCFETRIRHHDGTYRWISWVAAPAQGAVYASGRNVTAEREAAAALAATQEQLRQSQKMEAVGQLTGGLAHDFNNLLTGIGGSLELLEARLAQGRFADLERYVTAARGAAKRAAVLTHRLLTFSRQQTLDPRPTDVNRLVVGMEELIRRTMGPAITVEVVAAGGLWTSLIDAGQLENALLNLCINARDAMPEGGRLTVETANRWLDDHAARERDLSPGQYVSLCVSDTGTGMTPEVMARAFDPFFTTKPMGVGTGLGLSMVYGFARQSDGQARIYSQPGDGTLVCLYLPRYLGAAASDAADPADQHGVGTGSAARHRRTVLVVDDEPTVRMLVAEVLDELGYIAIEAQDGPAALQVLRSGLKLDMLITDVGLPGGMSGRQVASIAGVGRPDLKILFITGFAENAAIAHGHLDAGTHVMTKPFALGALATRIRDLLDAT